jgi:hypothetical protein
VPRSILGSKITPSVKYSRDLRRRQIGLSDHLAVNTVAVLAGERCRAVGIEGKLPQAGTAGCDAMAAPLHEYDLIERPITARELLGIDPMVDRGQRKHLQNQAGARDL